MVGAVGIELLRALTMRKFRTPDMVGRKPVRFSIQKQRGATT
jgi:hypothetical protein